MKNYLIALFIISVAGVTSCRKDPKPNENNLALIKLQDSVNAIVNRYIVKGIPGIQVTVDNNIGKFVTAGGFAKTEDHTPFRPNENDWVFSITKTFTAALIMKEKEKGLINIDHTINNYLPKEISDNITGSNVITVRMLMNHSSGIPNFTEGQDFLDWQFTDPTHQPNRQDKLNMVYNQDLDFTPGTDFNYSNSNYLLLTVILENISGTSYQALLQKEILDPQKLTHTYFNLTSAQLQSLWFPNYYADVSSNNILTNVTDWNIALANSSEGYGGITSTAADIITFYKALINGSVVSKASFTEMTTWIKGLSSTQPDYGLGIEYFQFGNNAGSQFGHEGDGVGCTTQIIYIPSNNTYMYINVTAGRQIPGPYLYKTTDFKNELCSFVSKWKP